MNNRAAASNNKHIVVIYGALTDDPSDHSARISHPTEQRSEPLTRQTNQTLELCSGLRNTDMMHQLAETPTSRIKMIDATTDGNPTRGVIDARNAIPEVTRSPIVRTERCFCRSYILSNAEVIPEKPSIAIETSANWPSTSRFTFLLPT